MSEKLTIQGFAGLPNISLDIKPINILIGPQAVGKSICAKLLYFFKGFASEIWNAIENDREIRELDASLQRKFNDFFPPHVLGDGSFSICYELGKHSITVCKGKGAKSKEIIRYSKDFTKGFKAFKSDLRTSLFGVQLMDIHQVEEDFYETISKRVSDLAAYYQIFIPAGRSFFANLQSSIFSFLSGNNSLDPFLREFGLRYEGSKDFQIERSISNESRKRIYAEMQNLSEKILCGRYSHEKKGDYIYLKDKRKIPVMNSSSGQQEFLPLAMILIAIPFTGVLAKGRSIYIEEPEAHLFPDAQKNIVEMLASVYNLTAHIQIMVTTHSPYILTAFNNLLQAGLIQKNASKAQQARLYEIVPHEQILTSGNLSVYSLSHSGCESIMDPKTNLISTNVIDEVSEGLAIQFDKLLDMEQ